MIDKKDIMVDVDGNRMDMAGGVERLISSDNGQKVFGIELNNVDPQVAEFLRSGVTWVTNELSLRGAATAREYGEKIGNALSKKHGSKLGAIAYNGWLFGLSGIDLGLNLKKTVKEGYEEIHALREQAQPLLAANHQADSNIGGALTANYGVLAHARAKISRDMKTNIIGALVSGLSILPNVVMGIQMRELDKYHPGHGLDGVERDVPEVNATDAVEALKKGSKREFWNRMIHPDPHHNNPQDYIDNIKALRASPAYVGLVAAMLGRRVTSKQQPKDAWDRIVELGHFVKGDTTPDIEEVKEKVRAIFQQRTTDLGLDYKLEGGAFDSATKVIAEAIVEDKLHPQALAEILDNNKIVKFNKHDVDFGETDEVKHQVDKLVMKYSSGHVEQEVYQNAPFTKKTLAETYKNISEEEKPFFTMLFPSGVLENAGVKHAEVKKYREAGKQEFVDQLTEIVRFLQTKGRDELIQEGVKGKYIDSLEDMKPELDRAARDGDASDYVREHLRDVTKTFRNIATSAKQPGEMWKEFLARGDGGRTEEQPKTPVDHAQTKKPGDEIQVGT